jgi:Glycosyltransferase family 87
MPAIGSSSHCAIPAGSDSDVRPSERIAEPRAFEAPQAAPYYVRGLALGIPAYLLGIHLWTWVLYLPLFLSGHADFRQLYTGGYMVRSGHAHELYDYDAQKEFENKLVSAADVALPVNHPAYEELLFVPLSYLRYSNAYLAFLAVNLLLLLAAYKIMQAWTANLKAIYKWLPSVMFLGFLPIAAVLIQGQDSILLLLLLACACRLLESERQEAAGAFLGLALFKFQIVLPIVFLFVLWRRWRFVAGFLASGAAVVAVSLWLVGLQQIGTYMQSLMSMSVGLESGSEQVRYGVSPTAMGNIRGLIFGLTGHHSPARFTFVVTVISSCIIVAFAAKCGQYLRSELDRMLIAIMTTIVVSYHLLIHDLSIMLIPILVILSRFLMAEARGERCERMLVRGATLAFVSPICFSYIPDHFFIVCVVIGNFLVLLLVQSVRKGSLHRSATLQALSRIPA